MVEYTPEGLRGLTGDELLRQYRMADFNRWLRSPGPSRLAPAERDRLDADLRLIKGEVASRMRTAGLRAVADGQGRIYQFDASGELVVRPVGDASRLDPPAEFGAGKAGAA